VRKKSSKESREGADVAICYVEGSYPPPEGSTCEQWRAEGIIKRLPVENVLKTAPLGSFAQILVAKRWSDSLQQDTRHLLSDRKRFVKEVLAEKSRLENGEVPIAEIDDAVDVYRIFPHRMEVILSGPIWERWQWTGKVESTGKVGKWNKPQRLVPY
jgi:hypothetical protein